MLLETLALGAGLLLGSKLNISNETVVGAGLLGAALMPLAGPATLLFGLGVGVSSIVSNIVREKYNEKKEELIKENNSNSTEIYTEEDIEEVSTKAAKSGFWCFTSTLGLNAIPLQLLGMVKGLGSLLMPISIIGLVTKGWTHITDNPSRAVKSVALGGLVGGMALYCLTDFSTGGVFTYFLALISIPSLVLKSKKATNTKSNKESVINLNSFLYGGSTGATGIIATALVFGQTVLWGSGKDILGTIINGDASVLLDPYRLGILAGIVGFLCVLGKTNYVESIIKKENTKTTRISLDKPIGWALKSMSVLYCMLTFNPILVVGLILLGLVINTLDEDNYVKNISIPLLLITGILTSF